MASVEYEHIETIWGAGQGITFDFDKYAYHVKNPNQGVVLLNRWNGTSYEGSLQVGSYSIVHLSIGIINMGPGYNLLESVGGPLQLYRRIKNTAPTTPGAFTQPTGTLEIGDPKVFSVGASSDAEGNLSKYVWEAAINGGSFTKVVETSSPSFTYTIPTATTLKMRVKARDSGGLESGYRESAAFTVSKPTYYWSKHSVVTEKRYSNPTRSSTTKKINNSGHWYPTYGFTAEKGFLPTGQMIPAPGNPGNVTGGGEFMFELVSPGSFVNPYWYSDVYQWSSTARNVEVKGPLINSGMTAVEGTYPTDGKHTDGYWYVRGSRVNQSISPPSAFIAPTHGSALRPSESIEIKFVASTASSISTYEVQSRYNDGAWSNVGAHTNALTRSFTITTNIDLIKVEFRVRAKNTSNVYSDYVYSGVFDVLHNNKPILDMSVPQEYSLYKGDTVILNGTASDLDIGNIVSVRYRISSGSPRGIESSVSTGAPIPFNKSLSFRDGKLFDGDIEIATDLKENTPYAIYVWAEDDRGGKSSEYVINFTVILNYPPVINMISTAYPTIIWEVDDPDIDGKIVRTSLFINGQGIFTQENPPERNEYELTPGKLSFGENTFTISVQDDYGAIVERTFKAVMSRVRIPETQLTVTLPDERVKDVLLRMHRSDKDEKIGITRIIGGID